MVTDLGIAKALVAAKTPAPGGTLTQVGTSLGTPTYVAPEQAASDPAPDHRADLYALGCVAYEMLAGEAPFAPRPAHQLFAAQLTGPPTPLAVRRPDVPPALAALDEVRHLPTGAGPLGGARAGTAPAARAGRRPVLVAAVVAVSPTARAVSAGVTTTRATGGTTVTVRRASAPPALAIRSARPGAPARPRRHRP